MTQCVQSKPYFRRRNRWQDKRQRQLKKLANMRAAKARKRLANPHEREPKLKRWYPLEWAVRDKVSGETVWIDLRSARDVQRRLAVLIKFYKPAHAK